MERVTGIGGIFFKADDPDSLRAWYRDHLGVKLEPWGGSAFTWNEKDGREGLTVWNTFARESQYFDPSNAPFMINYRVRDLDAMLKQLNAHGVEPIGREDGEFGRFAWLLDPAGHKVELWEPPPSKEEAKKGASEPAGATESSD